MGKVIDINPLIRPINAKHFLNIHHDISLPQGQQGGEIRKGISSFIGHFYVGFLMKDKIEETFGKGPVDLASIIIGSGQVVSEDERLALSKEYQETKKEKILDTRIIPLTCAQYQDGYKFALDHAQDSSHLYIAGGRDCVDFVQSVYHVAGLSFHFTKCYTAQELQNLGTAASMKALLKYSSRDNFVKYFWCITGISAEEIALRLNIEEERVEELAGYKGAITANELDAARKYFSINIKSTDLLLDNQENIDEYFVAYNVLAEDLAKANPFLKEEEKSDLDQQQQEGNSRYAEGWQDACEALSLCHSNAIKEQLKEHNKEELAWLVASPSQMQHASKHVSDFFSELEQQQVSNKQVLDILALVNQSSEISSKEQVSLSQEAWFQDMLEKSETIQTACGEVKHNSLAGNMSLNLGIAAFDLSSFLPKQSANEPSTSQNSIELAGNATVRSNLMQEEELD
ncbi:hypothetical protein [Rickettsia endosymbiont of Culicoides newsteadi]|uniref:hypothetical protein n=1 Tax=Rickettsia endosymbiont of Culicoides newsteadi TaxID=1961830 RepID=UPI000B9B4300|nr:hypothetical protein [Rickettsia endosymbiont of Culicoides newsteadi]OZG32419.1 hypothetical protein RiCNE_01480 [Rickettsia endosymbiont of Culicoides newsteadi]